MQKRTIYDSRHLRVSEILHAHSVIDGDTYSVITIDHQSPEFTDALDYAGEIKIDGITLQTFACPEFNNGTLYLRGRDAERDRDLMPVREDLIDELPEILRKLELRLFNKDGEVVEIDGRKYKLSLVEED